MENLGVQFTRLPVLENIQLSLHCGELVALIGPNGGGKTSLLRALLGEIPCRGRVTFHAPRRAGATTPAIGYVPQRMDLDNTSPFTVQDTLLAATSKRPIWWPASREDRARVQAALERVDASDLQHRRLGELSGGELQRVFLALSLTPVPDVLLLDEPVANVDAGGIRRFYALVSDLRRHYDLAILLVSHDLGAAAAVADRMICLNRSIVTQGSPAAVLSNPRVRELMGLDWLHAGEARP